MKRALKQRPFLPNSKILLEFYKDFEELLLVSAFNNGFVDLAFVLAFGLMDEKGGVLVPSHFTAIFFSFGTGGEKFDDLVASLDEDLPLAVFFSLRNMINLGCHNAPP